MSVKFKAVLRYLFITGLKLAAVGLVALIGYMIYLDSALTKRFSTSRYQAPALVYARSLDLSPSTTVSMATAVAELEQLNYRKVSKITDSGQYQVGQRWVRVYRRPFDFPEGPEMAQQVQVNFVADRVQSVQSLPSGRSLKKFRLEAPYIGRLAGGNHEDRLLIGLEIVPSLLIETLLLVEDREFYHHRGISLTSIGRAALANLMAMRTVQGGSTLTQQLVKNLYLSREQTLWRKANEALMALIIDYRFSKNEILETYLNEVYFGQDRGTAIHGIGLASRLYFGKQVQELEPAEIATLVGIVKGPSYYDPRRYPERAAERRDLILQLMFSQDYISKAQYKVAVSTPIIPQGTGRLVNQRLPHYMEMVQFELGQMRLPANWQQEGLRVFTYLDPIAQKAAEKALQEKLGSISTDPLLQGAVVVANHQQAGYSALVGDRNPRRVGFNRSVAALRPVGSLIKPLIYATAFEQQQDLELGSLILDEPIRIPMDGQNDWRPKNFDNRFEGPTLVYDALVKSRNVPAVRLAMDSGLTKIADLLQASGVTTPIPVYPSLSLGAVALSPVAVAEVYAMLAQQGVHRELKSIQAITNHQGLSIYKREQHKPKRVIREDAGFLVSYGLRGVINEGTGRTLAQTFGPNRFAGKSGTTNDYRDSWFVAYDNQQVVTVWVGRDDNEPVQLTGSSGALQVVREVLRNIPTEPLQLHSPSGIEAAAFHEQLGVRVPNSCKDARQLPARIKKLPEDLGCSGKIEKKSWWQRLF